MEKWLSGSFCPWAGVQGSVRQWGRLSQEFLSKDTYDIIFRSWGLSSNCSIMVCSVVCITMLYVRFSIMLVDTWDGDPVGDEMVLGIKVRGAGMLFFNGWLLYPFGDCICVIMRGPSSWLKPSFSGSTVQHSSGASTICTSLWGHGATLRICRPASSWKTERFTLFSVHIQELER